MLSPFMVTKTQRQDISFCCGAEKNKRVDKVKGPRQGHNLASGRVPPTCLKSQPVIFPLCGPAFFLAPHIISEHRAVWGWAL